MRKGSKQGKRIDGQAVKMTDRRFLDVADEFLKVKESMGLNEQTIKTYQWNIKYLAKVSPNEYFNYISTGVYPLAMCPPDSTSGSLGHFIFVLDLGSTLKS